MVRIREASARACQRVNRSESSVKIVAVTKTQPLGVVQAAIDAGCTDLGENRVTELLEKAPMVKGNPVFHLIGHLQTNKVARAVSCAQWIHSIDSERVLTALERHSRESGKKPNVLIQVNTSFEESKDGIEPDKALDLCALAVASQDVFFKGLMTIGPLGASETATRKSFSLLRSIGEKCPVNNGQLELSMGMSSDYTWAIEEGATIIRVGTILFGNRA
jgi:pyridoxal phosphate enzyme (YggS family)